MTQPRLTPNTLHESAVVDFGLALTQARAKKGHGLREVARQVGLDRERLREVEEGLLCVDASTFNRIGALYPALRHHAEPLAAARQRAIGSAPPPAPGKPLSAPLGPALAAAMASAATAAPKAAPIPAPVAPASPVASSAPHPPLRVTLERVPDEFRREPFGAVLERERENEGMSKSEMARTLGVTRGTIANWEAGRFAPTQERYDDLVTVFPSLRRAQPPSKDSVVTWVDAPATPAPRRVVVTPPPKPAPPPPPAPKAPPAVPVQLAPSLPPPPAPPPAPKEKPMTAPVAPPVAAPSTPFAAAFSLFVHLGAVKRSADAAVFRSVLETMAKQGISAADALAALEMM